MKILDAFGREITPDKKPDGRVLGAVSIRDRDGGYPSYGLTPQKLARIFREADAGDPLRLVELFEEMEEKDGHLFSVLEKRRAAVAELAYEIVPFSQEKRDVEIAGFVRETIDGLPDFDGNVRDMADAIGKGYSTLEIFWGIKNNRNVVTRMEWVQPKRFTWADSLTPRLLTEAEPSSGIDLPPFKFLFHVHKTKSGIDTRQGLLRVCAWMYLFKNYDIKDWAAFAEVYGLPLRLGKYGAGASKDEKDALIRAVKAIGHDAAGIISEGTSIEFIEAVKSASADFFKIFAEFCNAEISKAVLGQTLTTDPGDRGARSLGQVHEKAEKRLTRSDAKQNAKTLRRDLIRPLVGFNYGWDAPIPWFVFAVEDKEDLKAEAERYEIHAARVDIGEEHYRDKFNLPKPAEGEAVVASVARVFQPVKVESGSPAKNKGACPHCGGESRGTANLFPPVGARHAVPLQNKGGIEGGFALWRGKAAADDPLSDVSPTQDPIVERLMTEAGLEAFIDPVARLLEESASLEEFRDKLLEVYADMDPVDLGNLLQRAFTVADLAGRLEARQVS